MRGDAHVRFGGRAEETGRSKDRNRASVRPYKYVRSWQGWLYLAAVVHCYSRRVVGWSMRANLEAELVVDALEMAVTSRRPQPGLIHHSDQGSQPRLKGSLQHLLVRVRVGVDREIRRGSSSRASCVVDPSGRWRQRRGLRGSVC
jgi:transposase InsO family protein